MRYSCDPEDMGYDAYQKLRESGKIIYVYLNGRKFRAPVITADVEEGYIHFRCIDDDGYVLLDPDDPRMCLTNHIFGKIEVEIKDDPKFGIEIKTGPTFH